MRATVSTRPVLMESQLERFRYVKAVSGCRKDLHVFRTVENSKTELVVASHGFSTDKYLVSVATSDQYN